MYIYLNTGTLNRMAVLVTLLGVLLLTMGCIRGSVTNPDDGDEPVGEATVEIFEWPHAPGYLDQWPNAGDPNYPNAEHVGDTVSMFFDVPDGDGLYNWGILHELIAGDCSADTPGVTQDWVEITYDGFRRIRITKDGFRPSFYYLRSEFEECEVRYCEDGSWGDWDVGDCANFEDLELMPEDPEYSHIKPYDFVSDPRALDQDHEFQCVELPEQEGEVGLVGLRAGVSVGNVGPGPFQLKATAMGTYIGDLELQLYHTDGTLKNPAPVLDEAAFEYHSGSDHSHFHVNDWAKMRLLDDVNSCDTNPDGRNSDCVVRSGDKISFCLAGTHPFDQEIRSEYGTSLDYGCSDSKDAQGVDPGMGDIYSAELEGQAIVLGEPPNPVEPGTYLLEGEHDPEGHFAEYERTRENNVARVEVEVPEFSNSLIDPNCGGEVLDCTAFSEQNLDPESGHCRDYLRCETTADCPNNLTCVEVDDPPGDGRYPVTSFCVPD